MISDNSMGLQGLVRCFLLYTLYLSLRNIRIFLGDYALMRVKEFLEGVLNISNIRLNGLEPFSAVILNSLNFGFSLFVAILVFY